jgi:hypothetical protein
VGGVRPIEIGIWKVEKRDHRAEISAFNPLGTQFNGFISMCMYKKDLCKIERKKGTLE